MEKNIAISQANLSEKDLIDLQNYDIQEKVGQIDKWKYYKIINLSDKINYFAKSSSKLLDNFKRGAIIDFFREIDINSKIYYPTILNFIGYSLTNFKNKGKPVIITEYASKYTLKSLLSQINKNVDIKDWNDTKKLIVIYGIASGMSFLHSHNIVHRNLNLESIFLDQNFLPKITNFIFSKKSPQNDFIREYQIKGDINYQPPEVSTRLLYSKSSDVYSFSLIVYAILTNNEPFQKLNDTIEIKNHRPTFDVPISKCYQDLIERCWSQDPKDRPTFDEIVNELRTNSNFITETVNKHEYENYIKSIENAPRSFNTEENKRKLDDFLKNKKETFYHNYIDNSFDFYNPIDLTNYHIRNQIKENNEYKTYNIERDKSNYDPFKTDICRKEINFFFRNEIINLYHKLNILSQVKHPSIIYFIGYSPVDFNDAQRPVIVKGHHIDLLVVYNHFNELPFTTKFIIIYGIAYGMAYLHSHDIIHCDLKLENITIDSNDVPKIDGFDVSIDLKNDVKEKFKTIKGTPAYLAPEIYRNQEYSKASDVYSFGMILYEIMTGQKAFEGMNNPNEIKNALLNEKKRPSIDYPINETYRELLERCWCDEPTSRPTFDEILHELQTNRDLISEDFDEDFFNEYIKYLENSKIEFNPSKRITCLYKIIATKLQTYPVLDSYSSLSSMYETEFNDLCFNYNYIDLNRFQFTKMKLIHRFFYDYKQIVDKETNEIFMIKFPNKSLKHFTKNEINIFSQELSIISQLDHPAILKFIGYNPILKEKNKDKYANVIIVEYSSKGSLDIFIKSKNDEEMNFDDTKKLIIIFGIVSGMSYLHSHNILHCDLKSENIYLDDLMHPKISGFNISIELQKNSIEKTNTIKGTPAYLAPEIYRNQEYSKASDVYSFGMILYEIMTGQKAFEGMNNPKEIKNALLNEKKRPSIDYPINETYRELLERCWCDEPTSRPTFDEILHELQTNRGFINDSINEKEYQEYINFIEKSPTSFNPLKKISQLDIIVKNKINEYGDNDYKINFRTIYSTEFDNVLFEYNFLKINEFEKLNLIEQRGYLKIYKVRNKKTNQIFIANRFKIIMEYYKKLYKQTTIFQEINKMIGLNYPSILKFIGYSPVDFKNEQIPMFFTENVVENSIYSFFYDENTNNIHLLDETKRLIILYGIASGMSYLHSNGIIHGNLNIKTVNLDNFLYPRIVGLDESYKVSENPIPDISKLSFSFEVNENPFYSPERLIFDAVSTADDVYAFSIIAYYLVSFPTGNNIEYFENEIIKISSEGYRPDFKDSVNECYKNLFEKCWTHEPKDRPTFDEIVYHLKTNPEFITESINKKEFQDYVDYLDKYETQKEISQIDDFIKSNNYSFRKVSLNFKKPKKVKFTIDMGSIDISNYYKINNIGEGNFGVVYTVLDKKTNNIFAAKKSKYSIEECHNNVIINLIREVNIISTLNHPSIIQFIGYSPFEFKKLKKKPVIITEYVPNGSLGEMIQNEQRGFAPYDWNDTKKLINIYGIAAGMKYLHSLGIIHRDLKPENIFLDKFLYPKIGDFGLSKNIRKIDYDDDDNENEHYKNHKKRLKKIIKLSDFKGTPLYSSPEIFENNDYSENGDVYAFGFIVYEIITRNNIIKNCSFYEWRQKIIEGYRPKFDNDIPYCYKNLIKKCWSGQKHERPSFNKILKMIESNPKFITKNIDENEFNDYVSLIDEKDNESISSNENPQINEKQQEYHQPKQKQHQSNEQKIDEQEDILKDIFLDLSKYDIESVLCKRNIFKLYKLKEKKTKKEYQGQISMTKIGRISDENHIILSKKLNEISQLKHPSLLKFIGYSPFDFKMKRKPVIVTEFPSNGTLYDLFEILRINDDIIEWNDTKKLMNIYGIASGMSYLHSHDIIHRSLNSSTIFLDDFFTPKIGDFGLSTLIPNSKSITSQSMSRMKNESVYLAPEVLLNEKYSKFSDVYSFGMIVYEIISNKIPFDDIENENQIFKFVSENHGHLNFNDDVPNIYKNLIEKCLSYNPCERPTFEEIVLHLKTEQEFITDKIIEIDYRKYIDFIEKKV